MATIKEIAAAANVSVGTVSNVLNGKTHNEELIEKVEAAIERLGFHRNSNARNLRNAKSMLIGIVLGNLDRSNISTILSAIEEVINPKGYSIVLKLTGDNAIVEQKQIESLVQMGVDGIIINTASEDNRKWMSQIRAHKIPLVFMESLTCSEKDMNYVRIDYHRAIRDCSLYLQRKGSKNCGLIFEKSMFSSEDLEWMQGLWEGHLYYCVATGGSQESGYKAVYDLLFEHPEIDNFIFGKHIFAAGGEQALRELAEDREIRRVCVKSTRWIDSDTWFEGVIEVSSYEAGTLSAKQLMKNLCYQGNPQPMIHTIEAVFRAQKSPSQPVRKSQNSGQTIRVAGLSAKIPKKLEMFLKQFEKQTGIQVEYDEFSYYDLWNHVSDRSLLTLYGYDVFFYDIMWKEILVSRNTMRDISFLLPDTGFFDDYVEGVVDKIGSVSDRLYGLPFLPGTQVLFYQKDLFEENSLKFQFSRKYGYDLKIPENWMEFRDVAEFFTQWENPKSPVKYGTALVSTGNLYNVIDYLNRLWAYGGTLIRDGMLDMDTSLGQLALENYCQCYKFTDQDPNCREWEDVVSKFKSGNVAMVILYDSFAFGINDSMQSKVAGNVGSAPIPGKCPVTGGWGMAIADTSKNTDCSTEFIKWVCGEELSKSLSILTGASNRKIFYQNKDLTQIYPWKSAVYKSYAFSRNREICREFEQISNNMVFYDSLVGEVLAQALRGELPIEKVYPTIENKVSYLLT